MQEVREGAMVAGRRQRTTEDAAGEAAAGYREHGDNSLRSVGEARLAFSAGATHTR